MGASTTGIAPGEATHFDDVLYFKPLSDLLNDTKLEGRDWGTVLVTKSFSSPSVTTGASVTLTITLSNTSPNVVYLAVPLTDNLPSNLTVADVPAVIPNCSGGTITAVATTGTTVSLSPGTKIPARAGTAIGTCYVSVSVTPKQPTMMGASAISYSNTIAQYSLEASPNSSPTASPDPASIRNLADSGTAVVTATPPPPIVTSSAGTGGTISPETSQAINLNSTASFTVSPSTGYTSSVGGTCGGALTGNNYVTNPITSNCTVIASFTPIPASTVLNRSTIGTATGATITTSDTGFSSITFPTFTLSAFADSPNLRNISAASGGGIGATVPNSGTGNSLTTTNNEGLRLVFNADYRYAGITLLNFSTAAGTPEEVRLTFYDSGNNVLTSITKIYCSTGSTTTNFTFDPGTTFRRVDIQARVTTSGSSSSFLLGAINACATGTEAACIAPSALPANNCP